MYSLKVENDRGDTLELTGNPNYTVYKIEGLTPPKASINTSSNATTDGDTVNSVRLENRNIVIYATVNSDVETNRINLYKYFPVKKNIKLYFSNDSREVYIEGRVELVECDLFTERQVAQISIICPKPYFKAVDNLVTMFSDVSSLFEFPFSISEDGIEFSAITANIRKSIINTGDVETGIVIKLFAKGTVVNPVIYDVLKRTQFKLNFEMVAGDSIVINTNAGEKSIELIRAGVSRNILGNMAKNSTWFVLESGDNVFAYDAESGNSSLQLSFTTAILYSGV